MPTELDYELANKLFNYDPLTGALMWKKRPHGKPNKSCVAGYTNTAGYQVTMVNYKGYLNHRIAWLLTTGSWPQLELDHINGVRNDNRLCNLREVTSSENKENVRRARVNNKTTGLLGVSLYKRDGTYTAKITVAYKSIYLGRFSTPEEAHQVYLDAKRRLHGGCTI